MSGVSYLHRIEAAVSVCKPRQPTVVLKRWELVLGERGHPSLLSVSPQKGANTKLVTSLAMWLALPFTNIMLVKGLVTQGVANATGERFAFTRDGGCRHQVPVL